MRTLLILVDGMRPDAIENMPQVRELMKKSTYTMKAQTVTPSVTLPAHMSLFLSVEPSRHGTTTNDYAPQVRPVDGLCEELFKAGKKSAFFYNWEPLRDLSRPSKLEFSYFRRGGERYDLANDDVTDAAIKYLGENYIDFAFLYLGYTDIAGHGAGWMSDEYMKAIDNSWADIERIMKSLPEDYDVIITADHRGHDRMHGTNLPEDMTIPVFMTGPDFEKDKVIENVGIMDIAPTIAQILGVKANPEWEGKSLLD